MPTIDAATNPALANQIINDIMNNAPGESTEATSFYVENAPETVIDLPGGYALPTGEVWTEAEVRELNGRDEEAIAKSSSLANTLQMVLQRGVVRIGDVKVTEDILDSILAADRDWLLINIYTSTFGQDVEFTPFCFTCGDRVSIVKNILDTIPVVRIDHGASREFLVNYSKGVAKVTYPNGKTQREMLAAAEKTNAELSTILLRGCIMELNDMPIMRESQLLDLSIKDRRVIAEAIMNKTVGPQLQDVKITCPDCNTELEAPLSIAALFQFS